MKKVYTLIFCIVCTLIFAQVPVAGLIGAWPFSGNASDVSGTGNNGTVFGATLTYDRCGNPNSAYNFNGTTNYIRMLLSGPTGSLARSVSFWARTTNTVINAPKVCFEYGGALGTVDCFEIMYNNCGSGVGLNVGNQSLIRGNNCLVNNVWHHIAVIFNPTVSTVYSSVNFYIDGVLQPVISCFSTGTTAIINTGTTLPVTIGRNANVANRFWSGDLDDFYLYNRVLTPAEVLQLYTACPPAISGSTSVCIGSTKIYSIAPITNATYTWTLPGGWSGVSATNTISALVANTGTLRVAASSSCGAFGTASLAVTAVNLPVLNVSSSNSAMCIGSTVTLTVSGANTYTWLPSNIHTSTISVTPIVTTVYSISATSTVSGCSNSNTYTQTVNQNPTLTASTSGSLPCIGSTGTLTVIGASTYTWLPGGITGSLVNVSPPATTVYTVTGSSIAGCTANKTIAVPVPSAMTLNVSASSPSACPGNSIILTAVNAGGAPPYTYTWTGGPPTNTCIVTQPVGGSVVYTVTSQDANNCSVTQTISVFFFNNPILNAANKSVCPGTAAIFTVTGAQTYIWFPGGVATNTYTVFPLAPSIYTVLGTSVNGCTASANPTVAIRVVPLLAFNNVTITCINLGSSTVTAAGGIGPYSYSWVPSSQTASAALNLISGTQTVSVFDVGTGCTTSSTTVLPVLAPFTGTVAATTSLTCFGLNTGTASIALSGNSGLQSYSWTNNAGMQSQPSASILCAGTHSVTVVDLTTACVVTQTFQITQPPPLVATIAPSATLACVNNSIILSAINYGGTAPHSYSWVTGPTTSFYAPVESTGGTYTYVVNSNDVNGCPGSASISLVFVNTPSLSVNTPTVCYGTSATLVVTGAQSYLWYPGAFTGSALIVFPTAPSTTYTVMGGTSGCMGTTTATVIVKPVPVPVIVSNNNVCENLTISLSAVGNDSYSWTGPNGFSSVSQNTVINSITMANAGLYSLRATDNNSCSASTSTLISVIQNPIPSTAGASVCIGEAATMTVSGGVSYFWNGPAGYVAFGSSAYIPVVNNNTSGTYTVYVTSSSSCMASALVQVVGYPYALPSPTIIATAKACINASLSLTGLGGLSYLWSGPDSLSSTSPTLIFTPDNIAMSGVYTLTAKNSSNCAASTTVFVNVNPLPVATLVSSKNNMCVPFCSNFRLNVSPANVAPVKAFYFLNATGFYSDSMLTSCFNIGEDKVLKVSYIDTNDCVNTATLLIKAYPKPIANFDYFPFEPNATIDQVQFTNLSVTTPQSDWTWFFETGNFPVKEKDPTHIFNFPKAYPVVLVVSNSWGCVDTIIKSIIVDEDISLFVPDVFSPNGDGLNDVFQPQGVGIVKYNLEIFDRWGVRVFNTTDFLKSWDGSQNGDPIKMETYIWRIQITGNSGKEKKYDGTVTILR